MYDLRDLTPQGGAAAMQARALEQRMGVVKDRQERWKFLTEGMKPGHIVTNAMEECFDRIIEEGLGVPASHLGNSLRRLLSEESSSTVMGPSLVYTTTSLGISRQVFPSLIALSLMAPQPMQQPTGIAFSLDVYRTVGAEADQNVTTPNKDYATNNVESSAVKELSIKLNQTPIAAYTKKLKAPWPLEAEQNLRAYHNLSMDGELSRAMSEEVAREINLDSYEVLRVENGPFGQTPGSPLAGSVNFDCDISSGGMAGDTNSGARAAYFARLYEAFIEADNKVFKRRFARTTRILTGPNGGARIAKMKGFTSSFEAGTPNAVLSGSPYFFGNLMKRWDVLVDPAFPEDTFFGAGKEGFLLILVNDSILQAGSVFAPYIMGWVSEPFNNPETFRTVRSTMSRLAFKKLNSDYYASVVLDNPSAW